MFNPRYLAGCTVTLVASYFTYHYVGSHGPNSPAGPHTSTSINVDGIATSVYQQVAHFASIANAIEVVENGTLSQIHIPSFTEIESRLKAGKHEILDLQPWVDQLTVVRSKVDVLAMEVVSASLKLIPLFIHTEETLTRIHDEPLSLHQHDFESLSPTVNAESARLALAAEDALQALGEAKDVGQKLILDAARWSGEEAPTESGGIGAWLKKKVLGDASPLSKDNLARDITNAAATTLASIAVLQLNLAWIPEHIRQSGKDESKETPLAIESENSLVTLRLAIENLQGSIRPRVNVLGSKSGDN